MFLIVEGIELRDEGNINLLSLQWEYLEIHSIVDDLSARLGDVGDEWLISSETSPKYFEFTPIEMHAITERLRLPEPTAPDPRMVADLGNTVDFLHRVRALKIRGAKGYVGTSNIVWNTLSYSLHCCKNLLALWISDSDVSKVHGLSSVKRTLRRLIVHYSMKNIKDLLVEDAPVVPLSECNIGTVLRKLTSHSMTSKTLMRAFSCLVVYKVTYLSYRTGLVFEWHQFYLSMESITRKLEKLNLSNNTIKDVSGLSRLYSLEYLDLQNNALETVLEAFGERSCEIKLDGKAPDDRERDTIRLRLALRRAKKEKEEKEKRRRQKIEEKIRYISGGTCGFSDEVESI
ncbi:hypothetical protein KIN20_010635 [Parelaphostrongylus tenuis]|uniref:Uncharacterized protein n=1 Tax=Parelaphostrongylus tenuis TaxID=148309 RepID=A0AAD5MUA1_PARTN|nr:hypothetical protein KIN20_010635 [Parelaphostrongylus tenuis]